MPGIASRGNSMSITAPMHWTMVPDVWASAMSFPSGAFLNGFPLPSPPHLEEGCRRRRRGGGRVRRRRGVVVGAQDHPACCAGTPPQERRGRKRHSSLDSYRRRSCAPHTAAAPALHTAAAPPTISDISLVIPACRFLL